MLTYDGEWLTWGGVRYRAGSGPHGNGALPPGRYTIRKFNGVAGDALAPSFGPEGGRFFIPLEPQFTTERSGFGIHPDGGEPGTAGCVGLAVPDASESFLWRWDRTPLALRPDELEVLPWP